MLMMSSDLRRGCINNGRHALHVPFGAVTTKIVLVGLASRVLLPDQPRAGSGGYLKPAAIAAATKKFRVTG